MSDPLSRAIEAAGGLDAFIISIGISSRTLADWRRYGVPDTRCLAVEKATNGAVTAQELAVHRVDRLRGAA
jgi:DNA-binding transcriptional regulator YdaS (Cro superfamily)